MRYYLYKCYACGKEDIKSFTGEPPLIICPACNDHPVAMELVKEVTE